MFVFAVAATSFKVEIDFSAIWDREMNYNTSRVESHGCALVLGLRLQHLSYGHVCSRHHPQSQLCLLARLVATLTQKNNHSGGPSYVIWAVTFWVMGVFLTDAL
jgi:hypothetical protein